MNPPSISPTLPFEFGDGEVVFEITGMPEMPSSVDVTLESLTQEIVGKHEGDSLFDDGAELSSEVIFANGKVTFAITNTNSAEDAEFVRVIVVAGGQTFTFE